MITNANTARTTSYEVVIPFYLYAALSFLVSTIFLFFSADAFKGHHFNPALLAITHIMTLGWGTMIILGASHQLVPVLLESALASEPLARFSFYSVATGIPLLVWAFFDFDFGGIAISGGSLINMGIIAYLVNVLWSISKAGKKNIHAIYIVTAAIWLLLTTLAGFLLLINFRYPFIPGGSLKYLSLHAHMGIAGWFLMLVIGVGSRLIPMFLISKYQNNKLLEKIYFLMNAGLISFIIIFFINVASLYYILPVVLFFSAIIMFAWYCRQAFKQRIRKQVDAPMKVSMLSVLMMLLPLLLIIILIVLLLFTVEDTRLVLAYGFTVFFGWITAIILGMTFKTLPFIVWNKVYHSRAGQGSIPNPKDMFSDKFFRWMCWSYLFGFFVFIAGIMLQLILLLQLASVLLITAAALYNLNMYKMLQHQPSNHG